MLYIIGEVVGGAFGFALIPLILMAIFNNTLGWVILFISTAGLYQGQLVDRKEEKRPVKPFIHITEGCEFSVSFPSKPSLKSMSVPAHQDYIKAEWIDHKALTYLRTDCLGLSSISWDYTDLRSKKFLEEQLPIYLTNNGITADEFFYSETAFGITGDARGFKYIDEIPVSYRVKMVLGEKSLILLMGGGRATHFPQQEIYDFFHSVEKLN